MRKIVILTASHLCQNPRVVKEATALGAAGYAVSVLTVARQPRLVDIDAAHVRGLPFEFLAIDHASASLPARCRRFASRLRSWTARKIQERTGIESAAALGPLDQLRRHALATPAELTILHTELPLCIGPDLLRAGRRLAVDMEDWYSEDLPLADRRARPVRLLQQVERTMLNRCAAAFATSHAMSEALAARYGCPAPTVIRNVFPLQPKPERSRNPSDPVRLIWFSRTVGPGRGLEWFLDSWALTRAPSTVTLLGDVHAHYAAALRSRLPATHANRLLFATSVPPGDLPAVLASFDVALALEQRTPLNRDLTITNKIFQYLNAGLAVIATSTSGQREVMAAAPHCGLLVETAESADFAPQLDALLHDHSRIARMQAAARDAAETEFSWEREAPRILAQVGAALDRTATLPR